MIWLSKITHKSTINFYILSRFRTQNLENIKEQLNFDGEAEDGIFWMSFKEFQNKFSDIDVCKYRDDFKFN